MTDDAVDCFEDYWPHYVRCHSHRATRWAHVGGWCAAVALAAIGLTHRRSRWLLTVAPVLALGPAWLSHLAIERNAPIHVDHPLWALRAGLLMAAKVLTATMDEEVARVQFAETPPESATRPSRGAAASTGAAAASAPADPGPHPHPHSVN